MNICLKISYLGTNYYGFQKQKNGITIQGVLEKCLIDIFNQKIHIIGCSRTDSGVHAMEYYLNFKILESKISVDKLKYVINSKLPYDIRVVDSFQVNEEFHSRYDSIMKQYEYKIYNGKIMDPFKYFDHMHFRYTLDFDLMKEASVHFEGTHDFKAFMSKKSVVKTTVRTVYKSELYKNDEVLTYIILGNGFLYNMIRIIIGTLIMVGENRIKVDEIPNIISIGDRSKAGFVSDGKGLCLKKVFYDKLT